MSTCTARSSYLRQQWFPNCVFRAACPAFVLQLSLPFTLLITWIRWPRAQGLEPVYYNFNKFRLPWRLQTRRSCINTFLHLCDGALTNCYLEMHHCLFTRVHSTFRRAAYSAIAGKKCQLTYTKRVLVGMKYHYSMVAVAAKTRRHDELVSRLASS